MKIEHLLKHSTPTLHPKDSVDKAIHLLISVPESALLVVDDNNKILGKVHQRDLLLIDIGQDLFKEEFSFNELKKIEMKDAKTVKEVMSTHELRLSIDDDIYLAIKYMYEQDLSLIPIVDKSGKYLGAITEIVILKHYKELKDHGN